MITLGNRIKYVRKTNKLNQVEFAKIIGISQGTLSEVEQDKYNPSIETIILIHKNFKVDLEWLLVNLNSSNPYKSKIVGNEVELLTLFRKLPSDEQDEVIGIIELKLKRYNNLK
ncbi:helix-turn-helix domain-containing protein [Bacillus sp. REN16]|uniref:helix-turn-helix domain-containing protein n=1 Tax=Bacillus sp. REN16 TaxID=2887296 RepID=UPI001E3E63C7|nr:helix-turn-helix transcriptional regulator [Bacillus sp. REN16]MCC3359681.1 helix-turn-helix domain-containing protein [Bacillus sp. REN16]